MIDRYLLRYLLAVVDKGSFTKAAAHCGVSQPTLSAGIAKLEAEVGAALLLRSNRRVELTGLGVRWVERARRIERGFTLGEQEARLPDAQSTLRLGVVSSLPSTWMEEALRAARLVGGPYRIEIVEASEKLLLERLDRGRLDVLLTVVRGARSLFSDVIFEEGYGLVLPSDHPLAQKQIINAEEVADSQMIVRRHCEALSATSGHFTARGVRPFMSARTTNDNQALGYVRAGHGLTVMPDCFAGEDIAMARLSGFDLRREIGFFHDRIPEERRHSEALTAIRETLFERHSKLRQAYPHLA